MKWNHLQRILVLADAVSSRKDISIHQIVRFVLDTKSQHKICGSLTREKTEWAITLLQSLDIASSFLDTQVLKIEKYRLRVRVGLECSAVQYPAHNNTDLSLRNIIKRDLNNEIYNSPSVISFFTASWMVPFFTASWTVPRNQRKSKAARSDYLRILLSVESNRGVPTKKQLHNTVPHSFTVI